MEAEITSEMLNPEILCPPQLTPEQHVRLECLRLVVQSAIQQGGNHDLTVEAVTGWAGSYTAFVLATEEEG